VKAPGTGRGAARASLALTLMVGLAACGSRKNHGGSAGGGGGKTVEVALTDAGCEPATLDLAAGAVTFKVSNKGTDKVSEFEVTDGTRILGEAENVTAGLERTFSLNLEAGDYVLQCPGGSSAARGTMTVSAGSAAAADADLTAAADHYRRYVARQAGLLVSSTRTFVDAVVAGDVAAARQAYAHQGHGAGRRQAARRRDRAPAEDRRRRRRQGQPRRLAGSFDAVRPALDKRDTDLGTEIQSRFEAADQSLLPYRQGSGHIADDQLTATDIRELCQAIDALAEPLSRVGAKLVAS
jgi:iron uptake system EfeUOB component EfeO/EfeM